MTTVKQIPYRIPSQWDAQWMSDFVRDVLARMDPRNPTSDFAGAFLANRDGTATIGVEATVTDQRTLPIVNTGNRLSAQSAIPLTSTGSASTAAIQIAAHTVQYGFGLVSYGTGSISGLTPATTYYVYADDPDYAGGSVAYSATTSHQTVTASPGRYYVGAIVTAISSPTGNVSAASSANPVSITSGTAHGLSNGQTVTFTSMPGDFAALNGQNYVITYVDADEFTIPVDGSLYAAYTSGGSFTRVSTPTGGSPGGGWDYDYVVP